ncbi:hypothetical protein MMC22_006373 [Lobaria immixta]|nr:hypothetical protein [Lobaria immixta]
MVGETSCIISSVFAGGFGVHLKDVPPNELATYLKLFYPGKLLWGPANSCVKLSILDLYTKIFPNPVFRRMCYFTIALTICYFLSFLLGVFLLCRPVSYGWDKSIPEGSCANENLAYLLFGITNLIIDALVLILPMPMLWRLHLPLSKKIGLAGMFGLGLLICVISLQRILWLAHWDLTDFTYTTAPGACWSILEPALGVVNACLPTMRPALQKIINNDAFVWFKSNRKHSTTDCRWKQNGIGPSSLPSDSDKNSFLRLEDIRTPLTNPEIRADHQAASDDSLRLDVLEPRSNAIQVTRTWDVETLEGGNHYV